MDASSKFTLRIFLALLFCAISLGLYAQIGGLDNGFNPSLDGPVNAVAVQSDGKVVIAGDFTSVNGAPAYFRIRAYNTNGDSADSAIVMATTYSVYQQWKLDNGLALTAPDVADSDGDGIPNLMEYALGSDPRVPGLSTMPAASVSGSSLTLTYSRLRTDIVYAVEVSTDLLSWTTDGVDQGSAGPLVTASTPLGAGARKFLRLHISVP